MPHLTRRRLLGSCASTVAAGTLSPAWLSCGARADAIQTRMSIALRAANQSMIWIASEAGVFKKHGLNVTIPKIELAGPETTAALIRGEWDFCHTGLLPVAETTLNGGDAVVLLRNADPNPDLYVMTRREITDLAQLDGRTVGILSDAYSGQTGVKTRLTVEKSGATAKYIGLGSYPRIYAALAAGEIDAGALPVDQRFSGERKYGWHGFPTTAFNVPSVFASTRRAVAKDRETALRAVKGIVEAIHLFKTQPDVVVPILQSYLKIDDKAAVEDLRRYFVPLFPRIPRPELEKDSLQELRTSLTKYPAAAKLQEADIADSSVIDEVERSGFIAQLYNDNDSK